MRATASKPQLFAKQLLLTVVSIAAVGSASWAQQLGIYASPSCDDSDLRIPFPGAPTRVYVAISAGPLASGISGVGFSIGGLPEGWTVTESVSPEVTTASGVAFSRVGISMAFSCQPYSCFVLMTATITPTSSVQDGHLSTAPPWWEGTFTPVVTSCDFLIVPISSFTATINRTIAVESSTWGHVKQLWR